MSQKTIEVNSIENTWIDSTVDIASGEHITITAAGEFHISGADRAAGKAYDADGQPGTQGKGMYGGTFNKFALVGKIGASGKPFLVGKELANYVPTESGRLFFHINDTGSNHFTDNYGGLSVTITKTVQTGTLELVWNKSGTSGNSGGGVVGTGQENDPINLEQKTAVELLMDASGSMQHNSKMDIAKESFRQVISDMPNGLQLALRAFGIPDGCNSQLLIALSTIDKNGTIEAILSLQPTGKTPIAATLEKVRQDLGSSEAAKLVVLVTDGEESCHPDGALGVEKAISDLRKLGPDGNPEFDVRINIVGFAIGNPETKKQFEKWANIGGGAYYDAADAVQFEQSVKAALSIPYQLGLMSTFRLKPQGVVGGPPAELPADKYCVSLQLSNGHTQIIPNVEVKANELTTIYLNH